MHGVRRLPNGAQAGSGSVRGMRKVRLPGRVCRSTRAVRAQLWRSGALALWRSGALNYTA